LAPEYIYLHFEKSDGSIETTYMNKMKAEAIIAQYKSITPDKICYMSVDADGEEVIL